MKIRAVDLRVCDMTEPPAVEQKDILFSWVAETGVNGKYQSAYRIIVSSGKELVRKGVGDIWDTGRVSSRNNAFIRFAGNGLKSRSRYWWKVILWDNSGNMGNESRPSFFDTGPDREDWTGKWIWKAKNYRPNSFAYFRKEMEIPFRIAEAKVYVSAHHHFHLYINGIRIGGAVSPAPTNPVRSKYYLAYDVTANLREGKNIIGAVVHYTGGSGQNYVNGLPGFLLQCEVTDPSGGKTITATDESWKTLVKTPYTDGMPFQQNRRITSVERFDANLEPKGWLSCDVDGRRWKNAVESPIQHEKWTLKPQYISEGFTEELITPEAVSIQKAGLQVFDAGRIVSGWPVLFLRGIRNTAVRVRYSENLNDQGRVGRNVANEPSETYYDEYIMRGDETEIWRPDFSYKAFRYLEVTGYPVMIAPENIKIESAHTRILNTGSFRCSNPLLNNIYEACIRTQKNNILGQLADCPHREQAQYLGDSDMQAETLGYFFTARNILNKVLDDFRDSQLEDGTFPFVYPANFNHPDFNIRIPEWDLHFCLLMWKNYYLYGDLSALENNIDAAERMMKFYLGLLDKTTGLVRKCRDRWHISDWPYPNIVQKGDFLTVQNIKVFHCLHILAEASLLLKRETDARNYRLQAERLKTAIVRHLYDPGRKLFVDSSGTKESHQGTNVLGYQYGLVPENDRESLLNHIAREGFQCKTLLSLNLLRVLFENGKEQEACNLLNNVGYPGWGYMIHKGYKTVWEGFDDMESHSHAWNAYPARLFSEYITGIRCKSPGFAEIDIIPFMPRDMWYAESIVPTVRGELRVKWEKYAAGYEFHVKIPVNALANLHIPEAPQAIESIEESDAVLFRCGETVESTGNVKCASLNGKWILQIPSGTYCFQVRKKSCG